MKSMKRSIISLASSRWLEIEKLRILADLCPHGEVAKLHGTFKEKDGFSEQANIIVNKNGVIAFFKVYPIREPPNLEKISKRWKVEWR